MAAATIHGSPQKEGITQPKREAKCYEVLSSSDITCKMQLLRASHASPSDTPLLLPARRLPIQSAAAG
ncbi:g3608 [Coccomyxa elongata]